MTSVTRPGPIWTACWARSARVRQIPFRKICIICCADTQGTNLRGGAAVTVRPQSGQLWFGGPDPVLRTNLGARSRPDELRHLPNES